VGFADLLMIDELAARDQFQDTIDLRKMQRCRTVCSIGRGSTRFSPGLHFQRLLPSEHLLRDGSESTKL
jgi:hypothetical protein